MYHFFAKGYFFKKNLITLSENLAVNVYGTVDRFRVILRLLKNSWLNRCFDFFSVLVLPKKKNLSPPRNFKLSMRYRVVNKHSLEEF